jgi:N-acetyl sugar amidotransferase
MNTKYQVCTRCIMDSSVNDIVFDSSGVCNYCTDYIARHSDSFDESQLIIDNRKAFHENVRRNGKGKPYDCIVGVSGGVDSSYALYLAVENGLRPLAVHLDNGWDSEIAQYNISNLVRKLGVDLYTHVIDWPENRDIQRSLFKSGVIDIEMIMDNAQAATNFKQASRLGLKDILSGTNTMTEGMPLPPGWAHYKFDARNIRAIQRKFGSFKIRSHPIMSTLDWFNYKYVKKIQWHNYLDYFAYNKEIAISTLEREFDYVRYKYKHGESVFTRFYQNYVLPVKFSVDKRLVHHSTLICSGQMTRESAIADLTGSQYIGSQEAASDRCYVLKKLGFNDEEFDGYMNSDPVPHEKYPSEVPMLLAMQRVGRLLRRLR